MNKIIITFHNYDTISNIFFQMIALLILYKTVYFNKLSIYVFIYIYNVNLQRGVETLYSPFMLSRIRHRYIAKGKCKRELC
jgi:hypothetical protein